MYTLGSTTRFCSFLYCETLGKFVGVDNRGSIWYLSKAFGVVLGTQKQNSTTTLYIELEFAG